MPINTKYAVKYSIGTHNRKPVIWIEFEYNKELISRLRKKFPAAKWSRSQRTWYLTDTPSNRTALQLSQKQPGDTISNHIGSINHPALKRFADTLQLKAYSLETIRTYVNEFSQLLQILKNHPINELSPERLRSYFLYCTNTLKLSENTLHSRLNALKFYFEQVLHRPKFFTEIPRPKKPSLLPNVLSAAEIQKLFRVTENLKHRLLLQFSYGMGLRVSELVTLKIEHIDLHRHQLLVKSGKGKKDRYVTLPQTIKPALKEYYQSYQPKEYLFEGSHGGAYSKRSAQAVFKNAMRLAKINKPVGVHALRHSYATHLMEYGTDLHFIQKLLGHKDIKTTLIYTHVADRTLAAIKSPLDFL